MRSEFMPGKGTTTMVVSVVMLLLLLMMMMMESVIANPQGQFVSQDVDDSVDYQQQGGRGGDQWWRNYEVVEEHVDDLDDQLEMLYMYSVNPLDLTTITTSPRVSSSRHTPVPSFPSEPVNRPFVPKHAGANSRGTATFSPSTTTTTSPPPPVQKSTTPYPYPPPPKPFSAIPAVIPVYNDQQASEQTPVSLDRSEPQVPRNRVRVIVRRPSSGQKVNAEIKDNVSKAPFLNGVAPKKSPFLNSVAEVNKPFDAVQITAESDPVPRTFPSSDSPLRVTLKLPQDAQSTVTSETYRSTDSTAHPFLVSASTVSGQLPRYSKLLNRYSLLDTVSRDLNSASSEHRDDLALALEDAQRVHSLRQTRNDVQAPSARSFHSNVELQQVPPSPTAALPTASSKRSRRRRPKTSPVPFSTEWPEPTRGVDWDIGSTEDGNDWDQRRSSRRPTQAVRTASTKLETNDEFVETTMPSVHQVVTQARQVPELRGTNSGSRRRTPSTSSPATISISSTSGHNVAKHARHGRTQALFTPTVSPSLATEGRSVATKPSTAAETLRTTQSTTASATDGANDVLGAKTRTSPRNLRQRTAPFTGVTKAIKRTTEATTTVNATTVTPKSKETSKFKPRVTSTTRRAQLSTTPATTVQPVNDSTTEHKSAQRTSFTSSRFRFRPSTSTTASSGTSITTEPASIVSSEVSTTPAFTGEQLERRKFKPRPNFARSHESVKPVTSTTSISTTSWTTTDATASETAAGLETTSVKSSSFTKKFRPRPVGSRFATSSSSSSSTTEIAQPLTPSESQTVGDASDSSSFGITSTVRHSTRGPGKTKIPPLTRLGSGSTPIFTTATTPATLFSAKSGLALETTSGLVTESTETTTAVSGVIGKRRRRPIGSKKPVPSTSISQSTESTDPVSAVTVASTVARSAEKSIRTSTPLPSTEGAFEVTTDSGTTQRRKFRRRKISQRSTLSGPEEHGALNGTTLAETNISSTMSGSSTSTTVSSINEALKPTTEVAKKALFGIKTKRNETDGKDGKQHGSLLSLEGASDVITLQADESGDSIWFSNAGSNVDMPDDVLAQGMGRRGSSRILSVDDSADDRRSWFGAAPDEDNSKAVDSSPDNVKVEGGSIDTRPLLISRITDDLDTESEHETTDKQDKTDEEEAKSKDASQTRSATFSVSSSTSVHDGDTSKSSSSKAEPSAESARHDDGTTTRVEGDEDEPKFIIIDKTALRGSDAHKEGEDSSTEMINEEHDEKVTKSVSDDEDETESFGTTKATTTTTAKIATAKKVSDADEAEDEKELRTTTSKSSERRGNSKDGIDSSSRTTATSKSSKDNDDDDNRRATSPRTSSRSRTPSPTRRQQSSTSTTPAPTTEVTSMSSDTPENGKLPSDTAVSYFGEDEESPSDHGALDDVNAEGVQESSYDPDSPAEPAEGHAVSADGVIEHSDPNEDSAHKTESAPLASSEGGDASSGEQWSLSPMSEFSGPIRSSSSINVEVLSKAPKLVQLAARREAKSSRSGVIPEDVKTRSRQSLRDILKVVGIETAPSLWDSSTEEPSENSTKDSAISATTKRDVSSVNKFVYPVPPIKTAADIAELFDAITSRPTDDVVQPFQPPSKTAILKINSTMANYTTSTAKSTAVGEDIEALTLQSLKGPVNCSKAERNICPKSEDYPREVVDLVIERHEETLNKLWREMKADRINIRMFPEDLERKKEELSVCDSSTEDLQPGWARDAATGKWMIILNTPQYPQVLRIESCQRPQRECLFISPYYKSTCVEHYSVHRLIAIRSDNLAGGPVVGVFKFPCGCSCKVEMFHGHNQ